MEILEDPKLDFAVSIVYHPNISCTVLSLANWIILKIVELNIIITCNN